MSRERLGWREQAEVQLDALLDGASCAGIGAAVMRLGEDGEVHVAQGAARAVLTRTIARRGMAIVGADGSGDGSGSGYAPSQMPTKALPEPKDPALVSRSRELAAWNDSRTWRGCSDYPPPSSVKPVECQ